MRIILEITPSLHNGIRFYYFPYLVQFIEKIIENMVGFDILLIMIFTINRLHILMLFIKEIYGCSMTFDTSMVVTIIDTQMMERTEIVTSSFHTLL
jgi:hypothetical protein